MEQAHANLDGDPVADLHELLGAIGEDPSEPPSLEQLKKEARGYGKRRADKQGSRDNLIYRAGYGADAAGALGIPPDQFAGILRKHRSRRFPAYEPGLCSRPVG